MSENNKKPQGFNPENLTFNGVKIEKGDTVELGINEGVYQYEVYDNGFLHVNFKRDIEIALNALNITAHYPKAPKILKRPDGSVISGLEEGQKVISIKQNKNGKYEISGYGYDDRDLLNGFVFLEEDIHLAETKAEMLTKKFEIQCEIDRLNAENSVPVVEDREFAFKVDEY